MGKDNSHCKQTYTFARIIRFGQENSSTLILVFQTKRRYIAIMLLRPYVHREHNIAVMDLLTHASLKLTTNIFQFRKLSLLKGFSRGTAITMFKRNTAWLRNTFVILESTTESIKRRRNSSPGVSFERTWINFS